ncbi:MAG TPA: hypothetical protein VN688_27225 [Gemmataceae bacterium]|nr:hypothetical protein [Gemmataceae bacterium]
MFVTKLKIAALVILAVGILAISGVVTHHALTAAPPREEEQPPQPPKSDRKAEAAPAIPKVPKELLERRLEAAQKVYKQKTERYKSGIGFPSELFGWSQRWVEAELALKDKKEERLAAFKAHVDRTREVERLAIMHAKTGQGMQSDADAATYDRISAEIRFFQAAGKLPSPPPAIKPVPRPKTPRKVIEP